MRAGQQICGMVFVGTPMIKPGGGVWIAVVSKDMVANGVGWRGVGDSWEDPFEELDAAANVFIRSPKLRMES